MSDKIKYKSKKKVKSWLRKTMLYGVLPAYLSLWVAVGAFLFGFMLSSMPPHIVETLFYVCMGILAAATLTVPAIIPFCRVRQAMLDFKNYDFSPYVPNETEIFCQTVQTEKYYFTPSPFDDDEGVIELKSSRAADDYFEQFAPERLKIVEQLREHGEFIPFNIIDFSDEYFEGTVEKRKEGEYITVTVTEKPKITFGNDGVHFGENVFPYGQCEAVVYAGFVQPYASAAVGVYLILSDGCAANFAFGTRIMSVIDKHGIPVKNRETANYILADPKKAFKKIGLRGKLKNLKK